jgi:hypothetical protein
MARQRSDNRIHLKRPDGKYSVCGIKVNNMTSGILSSEEFPIWMNDIGDMKYFCKHCLKAFKNEINNN